MDKNGDHVHCGTIPLMGIFHAVLPPKETKQKGGTWRTFPSKLSAHGCITSLYGNTAPIEV